MPGQFLIVTLVWSAHAEPLITIPAASAVPLFVILKPAQSRSTSDAAIFMQAQEMMLTSDASIGAPSRLVLSV